MNTANFSLAQEFAINTTTDKTNNQTSCEETEKNIGKIFWICPFISIFLMIYLSFVVRRKRCCRNARCRRPGFAQPFNFIDEIDRRWAYAACFVILTQDIGLLFMGERFDDSIVMTDMTLKEWAAKYNWARVFIKFLEAMWICLVFYPLLACIDRRHSLYANLVGLGYLAIWIVNFTKFFIYCRIQKEFPGIVPYLVRIPMYVAMVIVGISYLVDFIRNCMRKIGKIKRMFADKTKSTGDNLEKRGYKVAHHGQHVANLLGQKLPGKYGHKAESRLCLLPKQPKYVKFLGFHYSLRIVCSLTVSATFLVWIMIYAAQRWEEYIIPISESLSSISQSNFTTISDYVTITRCIVHFSNGFAVLVIMGFLINTLISYKRRWHQLLRGDHSWHMYGPTVVDPQSTLRSGLKFAGYQTAYVAWGWLVLMLMLCGILFFLVFCFIIPLFNGKLFWLFDLLNMLWPTALLGIIIAIAERLICRFCFLQDNGREMALNNRRVYNAVSYYFLVLNVIVGFFACLKRILIPFVLGIVFLSRLDRPLIMAGFEAQDPGFSSFVSMLLVDLYHNHPVVKFFVELMLEVRAQQKHGQDDQEMKKCLRSKMIRNRWWKIVTLANNPTLIVKALEQRVRDERRNAAEQIATLTISVPDGVSTIELQPLCSNNDPTSSVQVQLHM